MDNIRSVDLLESTHEFPCSYTFKVIGRADGGFVGRVVAAIRVELEGEIDPPYRFRHTPDGRHVAITLEPLMQSAWEVLAVYGRIRDEAGVVMIM